MILFYSAHYRLPLPHKIKPPPSSMESKPLQMNFPETGAMLMTGDVELFEAKAYERLYAHLRSLLLMLSSSLHTALMTMRLRLVWEKLKTKSILDTTSKPHKLVQPRSHKSSSRRCHSCFRLCDSRELRSHHIANGAVSEL